MVSDTSIDIYKKLKVYFGEQALMILKYIEKNKGITRNEIRKELGLLYSSVSGRVKELLDSNIIIEGEKRKDKYNGNVIYTLYSVKTIDWEFLDGKLYKALKDNKKITLNRDLSVSLYLLTRYFIKNQHHIVRQGIELQEKHIINILKLNKITKGIYEKYK